MSKIEIVAAVDALVALWLLGSLRQRPRNGAAVAVTAVVLLGVAFALLWIGWDQDLKRLPPVPVESPKPLA